MISIKFRFESEYRRVSIPEESSLQDVISLAKSLFGSKLEDRVFCLKYRDEEGDIISVTSDLEFKEAIRLAKLLEIEDPVIRFVVLAAPKVVKQEDVLHPAICDGCEQKIKGIRFKCLNCPDYDLCSICVQSKDHIHPGHEFASVTRPVPFPFGFPRGFVFGCPRFNGCRTRCNSPANNGNQSMENPNGTEELNQREPNLEKEEKEQEPVKNPESPIVIPKENQDVPPASHSPIPSPSSSSVPSSPVPSSPVPSKLISPFELKVQQLEEMGFPNRALNIQLLIQSKGDIIQVVKKLLNL